MRESPAYPPHVGLVNVVVSGLNEMAVADGAIKVSEWLKGLLSTRADATMDVIGPAPAPLARIKRRWRWHMMLRGANRRLLDRVTRYAAVRAPFTRDGPVRVVFDRDPVSVL